MRGAARAPNFSPPGRRQLTSQHGHAINLYALTELHDPEAIELFISEEDARRALEDFCATSPSGVAVSK